MKFWPKVAFDRHKSGISKWQDANDYEKTGSFFNKDHTYNKDHDHRIGPNLYGMFGRKAGAILDYDFSDAWKKADFIWTDQTLDTYLKAPHKMIPNNRMPFNGLSKPDDRRALITYMRTIVVP